MSEAWVLLPGLAAGIGAAALIVRVVEAMEAVTQKKAAQDGNPDAAHEKYIHPHCNAGEEGCQ